MGSFRERAPAGGQSSGRNERMPSHRTVDDSRLQRARHHGPMDETAYDGVDHALEAKILDLLAQREPGRTICPSEAARAVHAETTPATADGERAGEGWRELMEPARRAAARLVAAGEVVVTQGGRVVDLATVTGPIRLRARD